MVNQELRKTLRAKIDEKKIQRSSKEYKEKVIDQTFKDLGIDKEKIKESVDIINKSKNNKE